MEKQRGNGERMRKWRENESNKKMINIELELRTKRNVSYLG